MRIKGMAKTAIFLWTLLLALSGCGGGGGSGGGDTGISLKSITVSPSNSSIVVGSDQQYTATGNYSDGTSRDITDDVAWEVDDTVIAQIDVNGKVRSTTQGSVTVRARADGVEGSTSLTVRPASLVSINITPSPVSVIEGLTQPLGATGNYDDGTSRDLTDVVSWSTQNAAVATVDAAGVVTGVTAGTVVIDVDSEGISASVTVTVNATTLQSITVSPAAKTIIEGLSQMFTATGNYDNGTSVDISDQVTWSSSNESVATVDGSGRATGVVPGSVVIRATAGVVEGSANLEVTGATLESLTVSPTTQSVIEGLTVQFTATGNYNNGTSVDMTDAVVWSSDNVLVATVNGNGMALGVDAGSVTLTATSGSVSDTATLTVNQTTLQSIAVTPADQVLMEGQTQAFTATGSYDNGSTADLSATVLWSSSNTAVATVDASGVVSGVQAGTATITATSGAVEGSAGVTIEAPTLQSITLSPSPAIVVQGLTQQITATGHYDNGSSADITDAVTWVSSDVAIATVNGSGLASGVSPGDVLITASSGGVEASVTFSVNAATLQSIAITPADDTVGLGGTKQYSATGSYNNGATADLTASVNWSSSDVVTVTIDDTALARGLAIGTATIQASMAGVSGSTPVTVGYVSESQQLTVGTPHSGIVDLTTSTYQVAVTPGSSYTVTLTDLTDDADLYLYDSLGTELCRGMNGGTSAESCTVTASESVLYITVGGNFATTNGGATYTIAVVEESQSGGYTSESVELVVGTPYSGMVDLTTSSYQVAVTAGSSYTVTLTNLTDDADLYLFDSSGTQLCVGYNGGTTDESCTVTATESVLYISVSGAWATASGGATYTITVVGDGQSSGGYTAESWAWFTIGTPYNGQVDTTSSSYYAAVTPGQAYTFTLSGVTDDVDLYVVDSAYNILCSSTQIGGADESCSATITESFAYILVDGSYTTAGAGYTLTGSPL